MQAIFKMISPEDMKQLPDDENTPEKRAEKIWGFFGKKDDGELRLLPRLGFYSHWPRPRGSKIYPSKFKVQAGQGTPPTAGLSRPSGSGGGARNGQRAGV